MHTKRLPIACFAAAMLASFAAQSQQVVRPPKAQLWMDLSTGSMAGMPEIDLPAGMGGMMGGLMGGGGGSRGGASTTYGLARGTSVMPPRVLDIAFYNSLNPGAEASQAIPAGMRMGDSLPLLPPQPQQREAAREPGEVPHDVQQPKGRILVYWGCSETVRAGQPKIIDLARGSPMDFAGAFAGRHAPDRGAKVGPQHVLYPNERNTVMLAKDSSLVGEHQVRGQGVPASMKFTLGEAQNVMPAIQLQTEGKPPEAMVVNWQAVTNARAYYLHAMGKSGDDMILWSSAETPDTGMGLFDYLPNGTIERWTRERVLLGADVTRCAVPKGIFPASGGREDAPPMLRMMAYGGESNFAYPPRPKDPKVPWEPEWAVRVRMKSHTMAMLGQEMGESRAARPTRQRGDQPPPAATEAAGTEQQQQQPADKPALPLPVNPGAILRGIFGR